MLCTYTSKIYFYALNLSFETKELLFVLCQFGLNHITSFFIDDVAITVCADGVQPDPILIHDKHVWPIGGQNTPQFRDGRTKTLERLI